MIFNPVNYGGQATYSPLSRLIYSEGTSDFWIPEDGKYRIWAIGHGADGYFLNGVPMDGGCGGGGYVECYQNKGSVITIRINQDQTRVDFSGRPAVERSMSLIAQSAAVDSSVGGVCTLLPTTSQIILVPFASNGQSRSGIIGPTFYDDLKHFSVGGDSGRRGFKGGQGIFGCDGGTGGVAAPGTEDYAGFDGPGMLGIFGSGNGGAGNGGYLNDAGTVHRWSLSGGGGGGAFGGGGGSGEVYNAIAPAVYSEPGKGAAGCAFIERIG